jgi:hypothetical protein
VNPPYSNPLPWILKSIEENKKGKFVVLLVKVDCSTKWYMQLVNANAHIIFLNERLRFFKSDWEYNKGTKANFPSMIAILEVSQ